MRIAVLAVAAAVGLQAGCDRPAEPPAAPAAAERPAPTAPKPVTVPAGRFDAISTTAMGVTGDLTVTGGDFIFSQGQTYSLEAAGEAGGSDAYAKSGAGFSSLINIPENARLKVFRVASEDPAKARNGGFCGADPTTFIVTHEGVDSSGGAALFLLAFKGAAPPSAASAETDLCGTFMYAPAAG